MTNPYDPPTAVLSDSGPALGRVASYLTSRKASVATGILYTLSCFGALAGAVLIDNYSSAVNPVTVVLVVAILPFILGMWLIQFAGFGSSIAGVVFSIGFGFVTAFIFAASMHLFVGWFIRRRLRT